MSNPFANMTSAASRARMLAFDAHSGRCRALQALGLDDATITDPWRTADALHNRYGTPEAAIAKLSNVRMAMDGALNGGDPMGNRLTPESALMALRRTDPELLQDVGSRSLDEDPRLSKYRSLLSPVGFESLKRMINAVRDHYETPDTAQDRMAHDVYLYQLASPHDRARYLACKRHFAKVAANPPIAQDASARRAHDYEASFLRLFPGASIPPRCHY